jgi:DNA-directed RNA polymerase subunit RPC12/RpoP
MSFGVIVCMKCNRASGINMQYKTTTCPYCNNKLKINHKKIKIQCNSEKELVSTISEINRQLQEKQLQDHRADHPDIGKTILHQNSGSIEQNESKDSDRVYEDLDPYKRIALKIKIQSKKTESLEFLIKLVQELNKELGEFSLEEFRRLLDEIDLKTEKHDVLIEKLMVNGVIYEPKPGRFKLL